MRKNDLGKHIIYQLFLRAFTNEGTLSAAEKLLPHIRETGADIVYLCPVFVHDDDENRDGWSARQKQSGLDNPKNPYRMKDYFHVDPEYGTDEDLASFIQTAHGLNLRVMLDLVYFHCGPTAVFLAEHPDFIVRNPDGTPALGQWCFPKLDYTNPALREYLWENMEYFVREFGCDGYRCDVGDAVPLDFWREGVRRIRNIKPDIIMLNEGQNRAWTEEVFDCNYDFGLSGALRNVLLGNAPVSKLVSYRETYEREHLAPGALSILCFDNHDIASDAYEQRDGVLLGNAAVDDMVFVCMTLRGIPFLYNGNEIADTHRHSIWGSRATQGNLTVDWQNVLTAEGQARMALVQKLAGLRRSHPALWEGDCRFCDTASEQVLAYRRTAEDETVVCAVNLSNADAEFTVPELPPRAELLLGSVQYTDKGSIILPSHGFAMWKE